MTIDVLVCSADGTQAVESREVADDWFGAQEPAAAPSIEERISAVETKVSELESSLTAGA
jgi:hypothetical protein